MLTTDCAKRTTHRRRSGFTLLEVMIATAVTLLMMISLAQIFKAIGDSMKQGRSVLELNNRLRTVAYRIRGDLENLTAVGSVPADQTSGTGYIKIYDGSLTDHTAASVSLAHSRFGDVDDIFMGTARAGDVWFTGKVPLYILRKVAPDTAARPDDLTLVTIAAQHAEVVAYAQPLVNNEGNPNSDPEFYLTSSPTGAVNFRDSDGFAGFPDGFRLHYRTLLIRPDLNLPIGVLPSGVVSGRSWTRAEPQAGLPTPLCDMASAHVQCDLSLRRVYGSGSGFDFVAANSLEDLMNPANRFAHVQIAIPGTDSSTMPLLALGPSLNPAATANATSLDPAGNLGAGPFKVGSGFLHPAFSLRGIRAGEDLLATDLLAFDIKVFDPGAPLLGSNGGDMQPGLAGIDDNDNGTVDDIGEFGWAGSDDVVLSPSDPGYAALLGSAAVSTGDYVDLAWAQKLRASGATINAASTVFSPFSGYSLLNVSNTPAFPFTDSIYKSGLVVQAASSLLAYQPAYDTWTNSFEGDLVLQAEQATARGVTVINNTTASGPALREAWRKVGPNYIFDAGTDGIDNNSSGGVDDLTELETSPPYPTRLRGIKISVRMEDPLTRQVKQMSIGREFVTE